MLNDIRANNRAPAGRGTAAQIAVTSVGVGPRAHRAGIADHLPHQSLENSPAPIAAALVPGVFIL